jgi:hypothetical protein
MINVIPTNDHIQHTFDPTCQCKPGLDFDERGQMLVFHSFVDLRTKARLPIKKRWETIRDNIQDQKDDINNGM